MKPILRQMKTASLLRLVTLVQLLTFGSSVFARGSGSNSAGVGGFGAVILFIFLVGLVLLFFIDRDFRNAVIGYVLLVVGVVWAVFTLDKEFGKQNTIVLLLIFLGLFAWYISRESDKKPDDKKDVKSKEPTESKQLTTNIVSPAVHARKTDRKLQEQVNNKRSQSNKNSQSNRLLPNEGKSQDVPRSSNTQLMTFRERADWEKKNLRKKRFFLKIGFIAVLLIWAATTAYVLFF
jgi:hypothetical protein